MNRAKCYLENLKNGLNFCHFINNNIDKDKNIIYNNFLFARDYFLVGDLTTIIVIIILLLCCTKHTIQYKSNQLLIFAERGMMEFPWEKNSQNRIEKQQTYDK